METARIRRRDALRALAVPAALTLGLPAPALAQSPSLRPTPTCGEPTTRQTEGPYFKPASPRRVSLLEPGVTGTKIVVVGRVVSPQCQPVARALIDAWQADARGEYDNTGFTLRGHQFTDESGRYRLETVVPGAYPGRTRHIHVKVQAPGQPVLTTQLYFPGVPENRRDGLFDPALLLVVRETADGRVAEFEFVLRQG